MTDSLVSPVLVGREAERRLLSEQLAVAAGGTAVCLFVGGESGVGKSRLVAELIAEAESRGVRVLSGNCVELGSEGLPFAPLVDALRLLARSMARESFDAILGPAKGSLLRLLPNLGQESEVIEPVQVGSAQLLELVLGVVERLSGRAPVLLVIEDLHWADKSTLDLVAYLVRTLRSVPVMLVGTFRSDEVNRRHPLHPLLTAWDRARSARRIDLDRFDRDEVGRQVEAILGRQPPASLIDIVYERSEGNAFLSEEILGIINAGGDPRGLPPSLRDVLLSRVDGVHPQALQLIRAAAVGTRWVTEPLLLAVSGLSDEDAFAALRQLVDHQLLVVDHAGRGYGFRHALTRDAVHDDMLPGERAKLHAAYGEALTARPEWGGDDVAAAAADLAIHWYAALDLTRALTASVVAADYALQNSAPFESLQHLERALQIWPRVPAAYELVGADQIDLLGRAGEAAMASGGVQRSLSFYDQALAELREAGSFPEREVRLLALKAEALIAMGSQAGIAELNHALELLPSEVATASQASLLATLASHLMRADQPEAAAETAMRAIAAAHASDDGPPPADARITLGYVMIGLTDGDDGFQEIREGIEAAVALGLTMTALRGYVALSDSLELRGRSAEAIIAAEQGILLARQLGYHRSMGTFLTGNMVESMIHLGRWEDARDIVDHTLASNPEGVFGATMLGVKSELAGMSGLYDAAEEAVRASLTLMGGQSEMQYDSPTAFVLADAARARGAGADALELIRGALHPGKTDAWTARYDWPLVWLGTRIRADFRLAATGDDAITQATSELQARTPPARAWQRMTLAERLRADDANDDADADRRISAWQGAVEAWRAAGRPYELSYSLLRLAEAQAAAGLSVTSAVTEGSAIAAQLSARALSEAFVPFLPAAAKPAALPAALAGDALTSYGLTPREREVLAMLAEGRSNPQIAEALFMSRKTASVHVSNILAKLGVANRVEAATFVSRLSGS
ncbi:MAG: hypothetical protein JWN96_26 [Mycobacterium sp.]|nr:hypothetical protein [Mycobacterium sp.]